MALDIVHALRDLDQQTPSFLKIEALRYGGAVDLEPVSDEFAEQHSFDNEAVSQISPAEEARQSAIRTLRTQGDPRATRLLKEILRLCAERDLAS